MIPSLMRDLSEAVRVPKRDTRIEPSLMRDLYFLEQIMKDINRKQVFIRGMRDGIPIGLGYFAVSFSLGIIARQAGLIPLAGFLASFFTRASAGEYGVYSLMLTDAGYMQIIIISLITNLRYLLMNSALSQKFTSDTPMPSRLLSAVCCTDEIFAISIAYPGRFTCTYPAGATLVAGLMWAAGTACGITAGNILPERIVAALSLALYGMFLAIIIPVGRRDKWVLLAIAVSFILSGVCGMWPMLSQISSGNRTIILTILISAAFALLHPVEINDEEAD